LLNLAKSKTNGKLIDPSVGQLTQSNSSDNVPAALEGRCTKELLSNPKMQMQLQSHNFLMHTSFETSSCFVNP